jgi:hypothetical protein
VMAKWCNSDRTVMRFDLSVIMTFSSFWDGIDHILSFGNALGVCLVTQDYLTKTVIKQWWDSDAPVMRQWWNSDAFDLSHFQGFATSLIISYPFAMHLKCDYASAGCTTPAAKNSVQTVMEQWCNSDATTVMRQWYNSHAFDSSSFLCLWFRLFNVVFKLLRCHWSYFIILKCLGSVSMIIFYPFGMPWGCDKWHKTFWQKQWSNSDETVIKQLCDSDGTGIPLIRAF